MLLGLRIVGLDVEPRRVEPLVFHLLIVVGLAGIVVEIAGIRAAILAKPVVPPARESAFPRPS